MGMKKFYIFLILLSVFSIPLAAQENPRIDAERFVEATNGSEDDGLIQKLEQAEKHYKKGYYERSYRLYKEVFQKADGTASLNYKLGISALYGGNPQEAAQYFLKSVPSVAGDYHLQLGYAYQASFEYNRAREAFTQYYKSLSGIKKERFSPQYEQLLSECDFGFSHTGDSVPAFVKNAGPLVNTYYHEYGAVVNAAHSRIFYTSRRPNRFSDVPDRRDEPEEKIYAVVYQDQEFSEREKENRLNAGPHSAVAGISPEEDLLYIYHGRKRSGQIRVADITRKKVEKPLRIDRRIDRKISQETTLSETRDGEVFFISDRRGGIGGKDIWTAKHKRANRFTRPKNLGPEINTSFNEEAVRVSPDGQTLYFASEGHPGFGGYDIYKVERDQDGTWGEPENMRQPVNSPQDDLFYFPLADAHTAFISSSRPGGKGGLDIYRIIDDLRVPFTITGKVTDKENDDPLYARVALIDEYQNEELKSVFTDSVSGRYEIAVADTSNYALHVNAEGYKMKTGDISRPHERDARLTRDFTLEKLRHPYKLYGLIYEEESRKPIAAEILFSPVGTDSVTHRIFSDREDGSYSITFADKKNYEMTVRARNYYGHSEELLLAGTIGDEEEKNIALEKSIPEYTLTGRLTEEGTDDPVPAEIAVFGASEEKSAEIIYADSLSGKYSITVDDRGPFLVEMNADGYFFVNFGVEFHPDSTLKVKNVDMRPMKKGASIVAENILFNSGKATLRAGSYDELDRLVRLLKENPSVRIEVAGHTDNTGSASLNKKLSRQRALSVKRYLESEGIEAERIEYQGYGLEQPIAPNNTPEGRAKNRRVEIEVIE